MQQPLIYDLARGNANPDTLKKMTDEFQLSLALVPSGTSGGGALSLFMGPCSVIDLSLEDKEQLIDAAEIKTALDMLHQEIDRIRSRYYPDVVTPRKLLIKSKPFASTQQKSGRYISQEALKIVIAEGYSLIGVDAKSLDCGDDQNLEFARQRKLPCLLNLELGEVESGFLYTLMAAPMSLLDRDLVPVRPLLLKD